MRRVSCQPSPTLLTASIRSIGYSLGTAIADIVDNSVSAGARVVSIRFQATLDWLAIVDDGCGMTAEELRQAMRFGSRAPTEQRDEGDLGRYGLGLKTASFSQCRALTVISKKQGTISACRWDLDAIEDWSLIELDPNETRGLPCAERLDELAHGTVVVWERLDRVGDERDGALQAAERHLSLVFHRYLAGEDGLRLQILWNGRAVEPDDPFRYAWHWPLRKTLRVGETSITVDACQLKLPRNLSQRQLDDLGGRDGIRRSQGFYVYRNRRLVVWGKWFGLARHAEANKFLRIRVDIPNTLDEQWSLDIKKSQAKPPAAVLEMLRGCVDKAVEGTRKTLGGRSARGKRNEVPLWVEAIGPEGSVRYAINREHPLVEELAAGTEGFEPLLALLERQLPVNAIRLACANDRKIENESGASAEESVALFLNCLMIFPEGERRRAAYDLLLRTQTFADHADFIQEKVRKP